MIAMNDIQTCRVVIFDFNLCGVGFGQEDGSSELNIFEDGRQLIPNPSVRGGHSPPRE